MAKYHINQRGVAAICKAEKGACPFGENLHYGSEDAANRAFERTMNKLTSNNNSATLTDKQYEIAKVTNMVKKLTAVEAGKREDLSMIEAVIQSEDADRNLLAMYNSAPKDSKLREELRKQALLPTYDDVPIEQFDKVLEEVGSSPVISHASLIGGPAMWKNKVDNSSEIVYQAFKNAGNNQIEPEDVTNYIRYQARTHDNRRAATLGILDNPHLTNELEEHLISEGIIRQDFLNEYAKNTNAKRSAELFDKYKVFNVNNENIPAETLKKIASEPNFERFATSDGRHANYYTERRYVSPVKAVAMHPNANEDVRQELKRNCPDEYNLYVDYHNKGISGEQIAEDLFEEPDVKKLNAKGTYREYTVNINQDTMRKHGLTYYDVAELAPRSNAGYKLDTEKGIFTYRIDSGD